MLRKSVLPGALAIFFLCGFIFYPQTSSSETKKKKRNLKAPFVFDEPRWQVAATSNFVTFRDYDNLTRNGRGAGLFGLFRVTRAISVVVDAGYCYLGRVEDPAPDYPEHENTQVFLLEGLFRYDLDVIELHPFVAAGGSFYFFFAGNLGAVDIMHWGINLQAGIDFTLAKRVAWGFVFDYGWILKYSPPPGNDYPTFMQLAVKMGIVL